MTRSRFFALAIVASACTNKAVSPQPSPAPASSTFPDPSALVPPGSEASSDAAAAVPPSTISQPSATSATASPVVGEPQPPGSGTAAPAAKDEIAKLRAKLRQCYQQALKVDPSEGGKLAWDLVIDASGHVKDVKITCATTSPALTACVKKVIVEASADEVFEGGPRTIHVGGDCK